MFSRSEYLSQSEVLKTFKITAKAYQELLVQQDVRTVRREADMGGYRVRTLYVKKGDVERLQLEKRLK